MDVDEPVDVEDTDAPQDHDTHQLYEEPQHIPFMKGAPGAIFEKGVPTYVSYSEVVEAQPASDYPKFASRMDWEIARWAKLRGPSATAFDELLKIEEVCRALVHRPAKAYPVIVQFYEKLGLSYRNTKELNEIVDSLPKRHRFVRAWIVVHGERFPVYFRDIHGCLDTLWSNLEFAKFLLTVSEGLYADPDRTIRIYHQANTGKWWWKAQVSLVQYKCR